MSLLADLRNLMITAVCLGACLISIGLYFREVERSQFDISSTAPIGQILEAGQDVSRKPARRLVWLPLSAPKTVYEQDTIRTGPNSVARIDLGKRGFIELKSDSLAFLESDAEGLRINLASGDLFVKGNVIALVGDSKVQSKDGSFSITRDLSNGKIEVQARSGKVLAQNTKGRQMTEVQQGEVLTRDFSGKQELERLPMQLQSPSSNQSILLNTSDALLPFHIQYVGKSPLVLNNLIMQISKEKTFKKLEKAIPLNEFTSLKDQTNQETPSQSVALKTMANLGHGHYFWRIFSQTDRRALSYVDSFKISVPASVEWVFPKSAESTLKNFSLQLSDKGISGNVEWKANRSDLIYRLRILNKQKILANLDMGSSHRQFWLEEKKALWNTLRSLDSLDVNLSVELYVLDQKRKPALSTPLIASLEVVDERRPLTPVALKVTPIESDPRRTKLSWLANSPNSSTFEIQIGSRKISTDKSEIEVSSLELYKISNKGETVSVRSVAMDRSLSNPALFLIEAEKYRYEELLNTAPELIYPPENRTFTRNATKELVFMWTKVGNNFYQPTHYEIHLFGKNTNSTLIEKSTSDRYTVKLLPNDTYTWKVKAVWPLALETAPPLESRNFEIKGFSLEKPRLRIPASNQ